MKTFSAIKFTLKNLNQMPLLRTLVLVLSLMGVVFSSFVMVIGYYFYNERSESLLNSKKIDLVRIMSPNQEKIRLWASLGMDEAVEISLKETPNFDYIKNVNVIYLSREDFELSKNQKNKLIIPENFSEDLPYYVVFELKTSHLNPFSITFIFSFAILLFVFVLISFSINFIIKRIFNPLLLLVQEDFDSNLLQYTSETKAKGEMAVLIEKIQATQQEKIQLESEKMNYKLANQVAHDIRSPLEMLKGIKEDLALLPEESRRRIQLGVNRIEEIAFNLLKTNKQYENESNQVDTQELLSLGLSVLTEKKIEHREKDKIEIIDSFNPNSFGLFSKLNRNVLKSILSNLINNAVEALGNNPGIIELKLESTETHNVFKVIDNGHGIPEEVGSRLFSKGFTTKSNGNGLGLFNAKQDLESFGGKISFESKVGKGTTFTISLPRAETPDSFVDAIRAYKYERIIVLDDDPAFHDVWIKRLQGIESKVEHIYSVKEMFSKYQALHPKILLLSDFELMDDEFDGIDLITKLNHKDHSILVTARSEEIEIQSRCKKAGIKLLPKSLVNYVTVRMTGMPMSTGSEGIGDGQGGNLSESSQTQFKSASMGGGNGSFQSSTSASNAFKLDQVVSLNVSEKLKSDSASSAFKFDHIEGRQEEKGETYSDKYVAELESRSSDVQDGQNQKSLVVLIDDDKLVRINWSLYCKKHNFPFKEFSSIDAFLKDASNVPKDARIYIDSNLGDGIKGEVESEKIFSLGFKQLYLATGYQKSEINKPSWIIEVYSKGPEVIALI